MRPKVKTWRTRLLALLLAFSLIPTLLLALWLYASLQEAWRQSTLESLQALAKAKAEAIDQFTSDRRGEVERIAGLLAPTVLPVLRQAVHAGELGELPELRDAGVAEAAAAEPGDDAEDAGAGAAGEEDGRGEDEGGSAAAGDAEPRPAPPSMALTELRRTLALILWDQRRFEELMIIDPEGRVVASTHEDHEGYSAAELSYYRAGRGATHLDPVFESPITGKLTTVISTPIRDPQLGLLGVLAARLNLSRFFLLVNETAGLGETGETLVGKRIGDEVVFMAPTRHDPGAALVRRIRLGAAEARPLQEAARGQSGVGELVDYRGERVMAAWEHVPALDWGLVVKIDRSEAFAPVREAAMSMLVLLVLLVAAAVVAAVLVSRAFVEPLRELRRAADRISRGDFEVELGIRRDDEVGDLADSFERMVAAIKFFRAHSRSPEEDEELLAAEAELEETWVETAPDRSAPPDEEDRS